MRNYTKMTSMLMFATLIGCDAPEAPNALPSKNVPMPSSFKEKPRERAIFRSMPPQGWKLLQSHNGLAEYRVSIPQKPLAPKIVRGTITLDGRNERMVDLGIHIISFGGESDDEREEAMNLYPDFKGYTKKVAVLTKGYLIERETFIRDAEYYNHEKGISCHGNAPLQFACYWGTSSKRMSIYFEYDDLNIVLPYVMTRPGVR